MMPLKNQRLILGAIVFGILFLIAFASYSISICVGKRLRTSIVLVSSSTNDDSFFLNTKTVFRLL